MKNEKKTTENFLSSLLGEKTKEKTAGLTFSLAVILPTLLAVLLLFVGAPFGLFAEGYQEKEWFLYCNFLLPQIAYALTLTAFFLFAKEPIKEFTGKPKWQYFLLAAILQFGLFSLGELNGLFLEFLGNFGYENTPLQIPSLDGFGLFAVLITVAVLPALFEEFLFRGVILRGVKTFGAAGAVLLCGGLFSLFHQNPAQTLYQFCCGAAYALLALRAGSVLPTVAAHFCNNAVIVLLTKFPVQLPMPWTIAVIVLSAICLVSSLIYLIFFDRQKNPKGDKSQKVGFLLCAFAGILICAISWIVNLIGGV